MKILIASAIMPPEIGGPASYVPQIISRLPDCQFRVLTFTPNPTPIAQTPVLGISQKGGSILRQLRLSLAILRNIRWCQVIYAQDPVVAGLAAVIVGRVCGRRTVIKFVGDPAWESAFGAGRTTKFLPDYLDHPDSGLPDQIIILLAKLSFNLADKIIVPSKFLAGIVINKYGLSSNKVQVIYNSVELHTLPKIICPTRKVYSIVCVGRLVKWKKVNEVIAAVKTINLLAKVKVKLKIIGDGPERNFLETLAAESKNMEFLGKKSLAETQKVVSQADVSVLYSLYEGLPHTVIEAFTLGIPVVASAIAGTTEAAINNQTALTVQPSDPKELAKAIEKLLLDRGLAKKLVRNAFGLVKEKFNWEINIQLLKASLCR